MFDWHPKQIEFFNDKRKRVFWGLEPMPNEVCSKCHEDFMNCKCDHFHPNIPVKYSWQIERKETIKILRQICARFGDNNWTDNLHLVDILDKHLWNYLVGNPNLFVNADSIKPK